MDPALSRLKATVLSSFAPWAAVPAASLALTPLGLGTSNKNFVARVGGDEGGGSPLLPAGAPTEVLVRIFGDAGDALGLDRPLELVTSPHISC